MGLYACFHICRWMSGWMGGQMGRRTNAVFNMLDFLCSPLQIHSPLSSTFLGAQEAGVSAKCITQTPSSSGFGLGLANGRPHQGQRARRGEMPGYFFPQLPHHQAIGWLRLLPPLVATVPVLWDSHTSLPESQGHSLPLPCNAANGIHSVSSQYLSRTCCGSPLPNNTPQICGRLKASWRC